ncbi:RluA family pseudouridine synthase [Pelomyxa schiedti]|nr:RluA family pseudouridine synthase [Pelomyxa schiedti]
MSDEQRTPPDGPPLPTGAQPTCACTPAAVVQVRIPPEQNGERLDAALSREISAMSRPGVTRAVAARLIEEGRVTPHVDSTTTTTAAATTPATTSSATTRGGRKGERGHGTGGKPSYGKGSGANSATQRACWKKGTRVSGGEVFDVILPEDVPTTHKTSASAKDKNVSRESDDEGGSDDECCSTLIATPENLPSLIILFEDDHIVIVNKPPGMPTHPSVGHESGTVAHALLYHCNNKLAAGGGPHRPGICHRLDINTSGVLVVAKTDAAHAHLSEQFLSRTIAKHYTAICQGNPIQQRFTCEAGIARHPVHRKEMCAVNPDGKAKTGKPIGGTVRQAHTDFEVDKILARGFFVVRAYPKTGRLHQIRVHLASLNYPIVGDSIYNKRPPIKGVNIPRQMLHATGLSFVHPVTEKPVHFEAPLPSDFTELCTLLSQS